MHAIYMDLMRNVSRILIIKPDWKHHFRDISVDQIVTVYQETRKEDIDSTVYQSRAGPCEHGDDISAPIKDWKFLLQIRFPQIAPKAQHSLLCYCTTCFGP
jgi:hypothetical protein